MLGEVLTDAGMATIDGMVRELNDLYAERDELKARLAEVEAEAAAMRSALEDVDAMYRSALGQANERVDNLTPLQVWNRVRAALSADAGRETAERLRLLEELAEAATAFTERCRIVECEARGEQDDCGDWDACPVEQLELAVKALKGGESDAGTST